MSVLHESKISKTRRNIGYLLSFLATIVFLFSAFTKLFGAEFMLENMSKTGVGQYTVELSILELICLALYWRPKTSNIGFFLLCSYIGGAIVGELASGIVPIPSIAVAIFLYVGTMLRKPSLSGLGI